MHVSADFTFVGCGDIAKAQATLALNEALQVASSKKVQECVLIKIANWMLVPSDAATVLSADPKVFNLVNKGAVLPMFAVSDVNQLISLPPLGFSHNSKL